MNEYNKNAYLYIRWSSTDQKDGASEYTQKDSAKHTCDRLGLKLIGEPFIDDAISADKGKNRDRGLSNLLKVIKPQDTLLIYDLDRVGRDGGEEVLAYIKDLVKNRNIRVIETISGTEIDLNNIDTLGTRVIIFLKAELAREENEKRKKRLKAAWDEKKELIKNGKAILLHRTPNWIEYDKINEKYVVNQERANIIRKIYQLYLDGNGSILIANKFNKEKVPVLTTRLNGNERKNYNGWGNSYINYLLKDKAVIGLCDMIEPPMKLYPAIIDEKTFYRVAKKMNDRTKKMGRTGGRSCTTMENPFKSLLYCSKCGGKCYVAKKTDKSRIYYYIYCYNSIDGKCKGQTEYMLYNNFEKSFIEMFKPEYIANLLVDDTKSKNDLEALNGRLNECQAKQEKLTKLIMGDNNPSINLVRALKQAEALERTLIQEINAETLLISGSTTPIEAFGKYAKEFESKFMIPEYRREIRELLRNIIEKIELDLKAGEYKVYFKGGTEEPIEVKLNEDACVINGMEIKYEEPKIETNIGNSKK